VGVGVGVSVGEEVGRIIGVILGSGVGVDCFGWGITITIRLKIILTTTTKPNTLKIICCLLLRERLIKFSSGGNYTIFCPFVPVKPSQGLWQRRQVALPGKLEKAKVEEEGSRIEPSFCLSDGATGLLFLPKGRNMIYLSAAKTIRDFRV
jgi:hypothetical protein